MKLDCNYKANHGYFHWKNSTILMNVRVEHLHLLDLNHISNRVLESRRLLLLNDKHTIFIYY
jgi:hypothetical protein